MKKAWILTAMLAMVPIGAAAQQNTDADGPPPRGVELMREGMGLILRGLRDELGPMTDEIAQGWARLIELLDDFSAYEVPQMLPNGDIIIRRKVPLEPAPEAPPPGPAPDTERGEIDL